MDVKLTALSAGSDIGGKRTKAQKETDAQRERSSGLVGRKERSYQESR